MRDAQDGARDAREAQASEAQTSEQELLTRFGAYAAAFEEAYRSRVWAPLADHFTEDAVYEVSGGPPLGGRWQGRDAVIGHLQRSVDTFDREFDERILRSLSPPQVDGDAVRVRWGAVYRLEGAPDLRIEGEERAVFRGGRIARLEDRLSDEQSERIADHAEEYLGGRSR